MNAVLISINLLILIKFLCIIWIETLLLKSQNFVFMSVIWIFSYLRQFYWCYIAFQLQFFFFLKFTEWKTKQFKYYSITKHMRFLVCLCHVKCLFAYFVYIYKDGIDIDSVWIITMVLKVTKNNMRYCTFWQWFVVYSDMII